MKDLETVFKDYSYQKFSGTFRRWLKLPYPNQIDSSELAQTLRVSNQAKHYSPLVRKDIMELTLKGKIIEALSQIDRLSQTPPPTLEIDSQAFKVWILNTRGSMKQVFIASWVDLTSGDDICELASESAAFDYLQGDLLTGGCFNGLKIENCLRGADRLNLALLAQAKYNVFQSFDPQYFVNRSDSATKPAKGDHSTTIHDIRNKYRTR